jgi:hypothetical protein
MDYGPFIMYANRFARTRSKDTLSGPDLFELFVQTLEEWMNNGGLELADVRREPYKSWFIRIVKK